MSAIKSAGSSTMTSQGLAAFKLALSDAERQHASIKNELVAAEETERQQNQQWRSWADGWFKKRVFKQRFQEYEAKAEEATQRAGELRQQLSLSRLDTQFEMPDDVSMAYSRLCDDFIAMAGSQRIWDNVAHRQTNKKTERTSASRIVDLKPVRFSMGKCSVIDMPMNAPKLENANGGDIFLFPGFVLYQAGAINYALLEFKDIKLGVKAVNFQEEGAVPSDAIQVGTTWAKTNKDGSPDRRFNDNRQIPVVRYAQINLVSQSGLNEEYVISNADSAAIFACAWLDFVALLGSG